jgi:hypothetical protein
MDWKCIARHHRNPPTGIIPRERTTQDAYEAHLAAVRASGLTITEFITSTMVRPCSVSPNVMPKPCGLQACDWLFCANQFPYEFADGTQHWLLWVRSSHEALLADPTSVLAKCGVCECVWYENLPENRSVKGVRHIHVFTKPGAEGISSRAG